jgi:hypothetical protein
MLAGKRVFDAVRTIDKHAAAGVPHIAGRRAPRLL